MAKNTGTLCYLTSFSREKNDVSVKKKFKNNNNFGALYILYIELKALINVDRGRLDCWQCCFQNIILYSPHPHPKLTTEQFQDDWCRVDGQKNLKKSKRIGVSQRQTGKKVENCIWCLYNNQIWIIIWWWKNKKILIIILIIWCT